LTVRSISIVAVGVVSLLGVAHAAPDQTLDSSKAVSAPADPTAMLAYRQFLKEQADTLVGMTRSLAREIKDGHVDAAQSTYAPAHRYFERLEPVAMILRDLHDRMDARAEAYADREADPRLSGFHRLEYGLFVNKSTAGLAVYADRLYEDSRELRERVAGLDLRPGMLADAAARLLTIIANDKLGGQEERYSKTDLWNFEANIEGARQIVALLRAQQRVAPDDESLARTKVHFAEIDALLEQHKEGCGFKNFDELSQDDRKALEAPVAALAVDLSSLRGTFAMQ
jgi:Predicted periplasmic lipoprotein involved in iron transport